MGKRYKNNLVSVALVMAAFAAASCSHNVFDEDKYERIMEEQQPTDSIDATHTWTLSERHAVYVDASGQRLGTQRVVVLTGNPMAGESATVVADQPMSDGEQRYVAFTAPVTQTSFYAALVDDQGRYTLQGFTTSKKQVDFSSPVARQAVVTDRQLNYQSYTYCFEEEMPLPGDYDYNDVILRVGMRQTAENQVTIDVTLVAVGTQKKVAAGIRLLDYDYNEIESVETVDGERFDEGLKRTQNDMIGEELLLDGENHQAVLNLFEDAHWAMGRMSYNKLGLIDRYYYNVASTTSYDYDIVAPRTVSYVVTFKYPSLLNYFTLESLDPFIIVSRDALYQEVHSSFENREMPALIDYKLTTTKKALPWALVIPTNSFRYPLEGVNMGYLKDGVLFGAFMTRGHSFGEWARDKTQSRDWYKFPTSNQVF